MLPLQWVATGLVLVALDLRVAGWDVLANPVGWLLVLLGLLPLLDELGPGVVATTGIALAVSLVAYPPGLLGDLDPSLAWALSVPQAVMVVLLALGLARALPERAKELRIAAGLLALAGVAPVLVIGGGLFGLVGLLAFLAVASLLYLVYLLLTCAPELPGAKGREA